MSAQYLMAVAPSGRSRTASSELKDDRIRVNAVDPGVMDTGIQEEIRAWGPPVLGEGVYNNFLAYKNRGI